MEAVRLKHRVVRKDLKEWRSLAVGLARKAAFSDSRPVRVTSGGILSPEFKEGKEVLCSYNGVVEEKGNKKRGQKIIGGLTNPHK